MNNIIRNLQPKQLWQHFADLNAIPRPSKKEEEVIAFMVEFAKNLGLKYFVDNVGNVIIKKPATLGFEDKQKVILQSHLDMVHQKNKDTIFNFQKQGIEMLVDGDWVTANGTTLGADNGIGVAAIMGILSSKEIPHPELEALFTIDEETGMTGAMGLVPNLLEGSILLNLDTEEDNEIGIGCAGGVDITASYNYNEEAIPLNSKAYNIEVKGLQGGHSGMDIHKGFANANKILNRILYTLNNKIDLRISSFTGGSLRNAIPRESIATITILQKEEINFKKILQEITNNITQEFLHIEPNISLKVNTAELPKKVIEKSFQQKVLNVLYSTFNGVYRMHPTINKLVETSNNLAKVVIKNGDAIIECLARSSSESGKKDITYVLKAAFELAHFTVSLSGDYPGWQPNLESEIIKRITTIYTNLFKEKPVVAACHAGLECGILGKNYPDIDMVSFGPTIKGAHSPDEKVSISSTQKFWHFLTEILKNIPKK